jgi:hypothetical protein
MYRGGNGGARIRDPFCQAFGPCHMQRRHSKHTDTDRAAGRITKPVRCAHERKRGREPAIRTRCVSNDPGSSVFDLNGQDTTPS